MRTVLLMLAVATSGATSVAAFAQAPAAAPTLAALAPFEGTWRGPATVSLPDGGKRELIQTERFGPALGGAIRVVEGHGYTPDGQEGGFAAFGIISAAAGGGFEFRAYAQGRGGTFPVTVTPGEFEWVMPAGPGGGVRYTARVADGRWHEEGWYERDGRKFAKVFDMMLTRVGATDWPAGSPVPPR